MSLNDYSKPNDRFTYGINRYRNGYDFPCCICLYNDLADYEDPCHHCGHNVNAVVEKKQDNICEYCKTMVEDDCESCVRKKQFGYKRKEKQVLKQDTWKAPVKHDWCGSCINAEYVISNDSPCRDCFINVDRLDLEPSLYRKQDTAETRKCPEPLTCSHDACIEARHRKQDTAEIEKNCNTCGKFHDCRNTNSNWSCHDYSSWEPKEPQQDTAEIEELKRTNEIQKLIRRGNIDFDAVGWDMVLVEKINELIRAVNELRKEQG